MIIERNEFRVRFGKMKEAKALWLEICKTLKEEGQVKVRVLTDLTGPSYTLVLECELRDFIHIGLHAYKWMTNKHAAELYRQFTEICESSERILYHIEYQS